MNNKISFLVLVFTVFSSALFAQKSSAESSKVSIQQAEEGDPILSITGEQMEAIRQLEEELKVKEKRKKEGKINYKSDAKALALEREEKLKNILNPDQWAKYEKWSRYMLEEEQKIKNKQGNKKSLVGQEPIVID